MTIDGVLKTLTDIGRPFLHWSGLEKMVVTKSGMLFARSVGEPTIVSIDLSRPERHHELTLSDDRSPISICSLEDEVFITDHRGRIWTVNDGSLDPYCDLLEIGSEGFTLTHLCASPDRIWVLDNSTGLYTIDRSSKKVTISAHKGVPNQFSDILYRNGSLYVSDFHGGKIAKLDDASGNLVDVAAGLDNPTAIAAGPDDIIYAANFGTGGVARVVVVQ